MIQDIHHRWDFEPPGSAVCAPQASWPYLEMSRLGMWSHWGIFPEFPPGNMLWDRPGNPAGKKYTLVRGQGWQWCWALSPAHGLVISILSMCLVFTNIVPFLLAGALETSVIVLSWGIKRMRVLPKVAKLGGRAGAPVRISDSGAVLAATAVCSRLAEQGDWDEVTLQRAVGWESRRPMSDSCLCRLKQVNHNMRGMRWQSRFCLLWAHSVLTVLGRERRDWAMEKIILRELPPTFPPQCVSDHHGKGGLGAAWDVSPSSGSSCLSKLARGPRNRDEW